MAKFNTPCFIRKNTPEIRKKLEELGYSVDIFGVSPEDWAIVSENGLYYTWDIFPDYEAWRSIDCGENEDLFISIAALRDDSDNQQWFVYDQEIPLISKPGQYIKKGEFSFCMIDKFEPLMPGALYHKATIEELIKYYER